MPHSLKDDVERALNREPPLPKEDNMARTTYTLTTFIEPDPEDARSLSRGLPQS
jgi:hypothetical protein